MNNTIDFLYAHKRMELTEFPLDAHWDMFHDLDTLNDSEFVSLCSSLLQSQDEAQGSPLTLFESLPGIKPQGDKCTARSFVPKKSKPKPPPKLPPKLKPPGVASRSLKPKLPPRPIRGCRVDRDGNISPFRVSRHWNEVYVEANGEEVIYEVEYLTWGKRPRKYKKKRDFGSQIFLN